MNLADLLVRNGFIVALLTTGVILWISHLVSEHLTRKKIPGTAIAITAGLVLAWIGGSASEGKGGISDIPTFSGFALLGGAMLRDFTIVSTAMGAQFSEMKKSGLAGLLALILGVAVAFFSGALLAWILGYRDAVSLATLGAGACTFIVGPVTGGALGASSEIIALSIAAGVVKSVGVTIATPWVARWIGLNNPQTAMVYGGLIGTTSGVAAGLAATDPRLVPYGAITATFYTGLGCLLCPSVLYVVLRLFL